MAKRKIYTGGAARRKSRSSSSWSIIAVVILAVVFLCFHFAKGKNDSAVTKSIDGDITYVKSAPGLEEQIIDYKGMRVSFNASLHIPNWVAWELTADEVNGAVPREDNFLRDPEVKGCPSTDDYTKSGYDRGHMAPAGDMKWNAEAMQQSFYLTNILPQYRGLNTGSWKGIEEKCRARAEQDSCIYIVCGHVNGEKPIKYIGDTRVAVPQRLFKVICAPYANPPYGIAFVFDNAKGFAGMQQAATTIDNVEAITGHDFFSQLPDDVEANLESMCNFNRWSRLK